MRSATVAVVGLWMIAAQAQSRPKRMNMGMAGGSFVTQVHGHSWYLQQAVGQVGVAGSVHSDGRYFNQGFVQPIHLPVRTLPSTDLHARIFPNPFDDRFTIAFDEDLIMPVIVQVYNTMGRVVHSAEHAAQRSIVIRPAELAMGAYVVHVQVGQRRYVAHIIRTR